MKEEFLVSGSGPLILLQSYAGDVLLPRAQVTGSIPIKNHPLRLLASLNGLDFDQLVFSRNVGYTVLRACRTIMYTTIVGWAGGRKCSQASTVLRRLDGKFFAWSTGQAYGSAGPRVFDGIVETSRAQHPGLTNTAFKFVANEDHHGLLFRSAGVNAITAAMCSLGMDARP